MKNSTLKLFSKYSYFENILLLVHLIKILILQVIFYFISLR